MYDLSYFSAFVAVERIELLLSFQSVEGLLFLSHKQ